MTERSSWEDDWLAALHHQMELEEQHQQKVEEFIERAEKQLKEFYQQEKADASEHRNQ